MLFEQGFHCDADFKRYPRVTAARDHPHRGTPPPSPLLTPSHKCRVVVLAASAVDTLPQMEGIALPTRLAQQQGPLRPSLVRLWKLPSSMPPTLFKNQPRTHEDQSDPDCLAAQIVPNGLWERRKFMRFPIRHVSGTRLGIPPCGVLTPMFN